MKHVWREGVDIGVWWRNLKERDNLEDRLKYHLKMDPGEIEWDSWIGLLCLRIGTGGGCWKQ
jgi:hypothetical protein